MELPNQYSIALLRHSLSHVMTLAVQRLFGDTVVLGGGPAIDDGFYQDFDRAFSPEDLPQIEKEMHRIIAADYPILRSEEPIERALASYHAAGQPYKVDILLKLQQAFDASLPSVAPSSPQTVSFYQIDSHKDLCRGPHVHSTACLGGIAFKLDRIAGAYWRGNEYNPMLTRIYGLAFVDRAELERYLESREQAKARDHRVLGERLELFFFHETAPGMAYWLPKGLKMKNLLIQYWRDKAR